LTFAALADCRDAKRLRTFLNCKIENDNVTWFYHFFPDIEPGEEFFLFFLFFFFYYGVMLPTGAGCRLNAHSFIF
jgi:hypothetical protein